MTTDLHLIWNPVAGNGAAVNAYQLVTDALAERGIPFSAKKSEYAGHATELAKEAIADGVKKIVVLGGDGTIREVASAVMNTDVHLGIVSCGTGNDIIRPLQIPKDPIAALDIAQTLVEMELIEEAKETPVRRSGSIQVAKLSAPTIF